MAEGDALVTNNFKEQLMLKTIDLVNDVLKVALYNSSFTFSIDGADPAYSATNEISGSGYTAGGATLGSKAVTQDDTNNWGKFDAADTVWTALATNTIAHAVLYDDTTATKWQLIHWELATNSNGGNYTLQWGANGLLTIA